MKKILLLACVAALTLSLTAGVAAAAPTKATNYFTLDITCDGLGPTTIEVVGRGHWATAKVQGTNTTLIQAWAEETVTYDGDVVYQHRHAKGNDTIDDTCRNSWSQEFGEDDLPPGYPAGTYHFEVETGVKIRGR